MTISYQFLETYIQTVKQYLQSQAAISVDSPGTEAQTCTITGENFLELSLDLHNYTTFWENALWQNAHLFDLLSAH